MASSWDKPTLLSFQALKTLPSGPPAVCAASSRQPPPCVPGESVLFLLSRSLLAFHHVVPGHTVTRVLLLPVSTRSMMSAFEGGDPLLCVPTTQHRACAQQVPPQCPPSIGRMGLPLLPCLIWCTDWPWFFPHLSSHPHSSLLCPWETYSPSRVWLKFNFP